MALILNSLGSINQHVNRPLSDRILWQGAALVHQGQTVDFKTGETLENQLNGILLVFSGFNPSTSIVNNAEWQSFFIHKHFRSYSAGGGYSCLMAESINERPAITMKYIFINSNNIRGHEMNNIGASRNMVLRYVIGV